MLRFLLSLSLATLAFACLREFNQAPKHTHRKRNIRRQADFPPVLTDQETILVNSFDNNTIDQWAYYYTHENKLAGLGRAAAQWTVRQHQHFQQGPGPVPLANSELRC